MKIPGSPATRALIALIAIAIIGYGAWRLLVHGSSAPPALVTPRTNVHAEISQDVPSRLHRIAEDLPLRDRTGRPRLIALTFDDGPYPIYTPLLLDVLHDLHVPATFFLIGRDAQQWPEITRRIEAAGEEVADHTYSHPDLDRESDDAVRSEILEGREVLWAFTHDPSVRTLMRPPHGRYTERTLRVAQSLGYSVVLWTDDSGDWRSVTTAQIEHHLLAHATAPEIVLLHSGKLATIEALPLVVAHFKQAGYAFTTVSDLLRRVTPTELNHPLRHPV